MADRNRLEHVLNGDRYSVQYLVQRISRTRYMPAIPFYEGIYQDYFVWRGEVTVRDRKTGELKAACTCGVSEERDFRFDAAELLKHFTDGEIPAGREKAYADFIGEDIIDLFRADRGKSIPYVELRRPSRAELAELGLLPDENSNEFGQLELGIA